MKHWSRMTRPFADGLVSPSETGSQNPGKKSHPHAPSTPSMLLPIR